MRIAVFGAGGVGGYFGGRLAQAGEEVHFIARGAHLAAIRSDGLSVNSIEGDFSVRPAGATDRPQDVGPVDTVIVAVKAWQVRDAAEATKPMIGPNTVILPLENGVEAADVLSDVLGTKRVIGGLCAIVSMIEQPGHIRHPAIHPVIRFGELDNRRTQRVEKLRKAFERCSGLSVEIPEDIHTALWTKFSFISAWSAVGSVTRTPMGIIRSVPQSRQLLNTVLSEVVSVARASGVDLPEEIVPSTMAFFDSLDPASTASMQRDVMAGKPSELDAQVGAVIRIGERLNVPTPASRFIYQALSPLERIARGEV